MTGRKLGESSCTATNPIDRCWRCDKNWAKNRKRLAKCARGFGRGTTGGKEGKYYVVTDSSDDDMLEPKPGTLRYGVIQEKPLWIIFAKSMTIKLKQELMINSHKTIDGRGANVHIAKGAGLTIQFVNNVIIHNIKIHDIVPAPGGMIRDSILHFGLRTMSDGDGISIFGSNHIWIDHVSMYKCTDGLIDAIMASTAITISNCKFNHHNDVSFPFPPQNSLISSLSLRSTTTWDSRKIEKRCVLEWLLLGDAFGCKWWIWGRCYYANYGCIQ